MAEKESGYYAVIPSQVRYDKSLSKSAILLYGELSALSNKFGYCFASNNYFAKLYQTNTRTVRRWLAELRDAGHIKTKVNEEAGNTRKIWLTLGTKVSAGEDEIVLTPEDKNVLHNNTSINTKSNSLAQILNQRASDIYSYYPRKVGRAAAIRAIKTALKRVPFEKLRAATMSFASVRPDKNDSFTPYPATWFNQERYNDDPATWKPITQKRKGWVTPKDRQQQKEDEEFEKYEAERLKRKQQQERNNQ